MERIIINADDFGLSKGVNEGILYCYRNGIVNSSSIMVTYDSFIEAVEIIKEHKLNNIGLHCNLTEGKSLLNSHKTITDATGNFFRNIHDRENVCLNEVRAEIEAQYNKALNAGIKLNHIDTHHHVHMSDSLRNVFIDFSNKYRLPLRKMKNTYINPKKIIKFYKDVSEVEFYTSSFVTQFYGEDATEDRLLKILSRYKRKNVEIMCHPGFLDDDNGEYNKQRVNELIVLTSEKLRKIILK